MFGLIKQLFKVLLMFGVPLFLTVGVWFLLGPDTFWQTLTTLIVGIVVSVVSFIAVCLALNEMI